MNLKLRLSRKLKRTGGFTLIEMLIVVAIIAILVAVSIPMVSGALDKAKVATDQANERAAKAAAMITYMTAGTIGACYYDADAGTIVSGTPAASGAPKYGQCSQHKDGYITLTIGTDGTISDLAWTSYASGGSATAHG